MKAALFVSTGAPLISVFHQLPGGKSGKGGGSGPPRIWARTRNVTAPVAGIWLFSFTICVCSNNRQVRSYARRVSRAKRGFCELRGKVLSMPAVTPEMNRPGRSVIKLSLGVSLFAVAAMVAAVVIIGAPEAYSSAVYTLTG